MTNVNVLSWTRERETHKMRERAGENKNIYNAKRYDIQKKSFIICENT